MPKRKTSRAKKSKSSGKAKKKTAPKKSPARKKSASARTSTSAKKSARAKRPVPSSRALSRARSSRARSGVRDFDINLPARSGTGPAAGGQSGDIESLPDTAIVDSESVEELAAEGQDYEAEIVDGIEGAPDPDQGEIETREVPEDDVPDEYKNDRSNR